MVNNEMYFSAAFLSILASMAAFGFLITQLIFMCFGRSRKSKPKKQKTPSGITGREHGESSGATTSNSGDRDRARINGDNSGVNGDKAESNGDLPRVNSGSSGVNGDKAESNDDCAMGNVEINNDCARVNVGSSEIYGDKPRINGDAMVNNDPEINGDIEKVNSNRLKKTDGCCCHDGGAVNVSGKDDKGVDGDRKSSSDSSLKDGKDVCDDDANCCCEGSEYYNSVDKMRSDDSYGFSDSHNHSNCKDDGIAGSDGIVVPVRTQIMTKADDFDKPFSGRQTVSKKTKAINRSSTKDNVTLAESINDGIIGIGLTTNYVYVDEKLKELDVTCFDKEISVVEHMTTLTRDIAVQVFEEDCTSAESRQNSSTTSCCCSSEYDREIDSISLSDQTMNFDDEVFSTMSINAPEHSININDQDFEHESEEEIESPKEKSSSNSSIVGRILSSIARSVECCIAALISASGRSEDDVRN